MTHYILVYLGQPKIEKEEDQKQHRMDYQQWLKSLGEAAVSPANPVRSPKIVHPDGSVTAGSKTNMTGYTIIAAESEEKALEIAKSCPFVKVDGSLEVAELMKMPF